MTASPDDTPALGIVARVGRYAATHGRRVTLGWLALLVITVGVSGAVGSHYVNNFSLKGTQAQKAIDLLQADFPSQSGDLDQIVVHTPTGAVSDPETKATVEAMLAKVAKLPHVTGVVSPYGPAGRVAVSKDGRTAFATVSFDDRADKLPKPAIQSVIDTARDAGSKTLQVALGGQAIEQAQQPSFGIASIVGLLAAIIILLVTFGSFAAMGLPIITALLGLGTAFGLIGLGSWVFDMPDFATELAAMIGLGVGIDYALFIVTRFRESYGDGANTQDAIVKAMDTAGRAVLFAGVTVIISLLGMFLLGVGFLYGLALSSALAVLMTMLAALTVLPALLARFGQRIGERHRAGLAKREATGGKPMLWPRWAGLVSRHPWPAMALGLGIMLGLAIPALSLRLGQSDAGNDQTGQTTRRAYDLLADGFGKGFNGPLTLVAQLPQAGDDAALAKITSTVKTTPGVASVAEPTLSPAGRTAVIQVFPSTAPEAGATTDLVNRLREDQLPALERATGTRLVVGGVTAIGVDFAHVLSSKLPLFIGVVVLLAALLLLLVFRSLVIPVQAAVMNLLSIGAALGVVVMIFQHGWLLGIPPGPIDAFIPVFMFAIIFGLSMDYEVFLVSRIHEEWMRRKDPTAAVVEGLGATGRVITAAATIMVVVFLSFVFGGQRVVEMFGLSLATAVFLDAFVVRSLLLPAVLILVGKRTWWLPEWLDRRMPHLAIDAPATQAAPLAQPRPAFETRGR